MDTNKDRNTEIVYLKEQGYSYGYIAKRYGLSKDTIKNICHRYGVYGEQPKKVTKVGVITQDKLF